MPWFSSQQVTQVCELHSFSTIQKQVCAGSDAVKHALHVCLGCPGHPSLFLESSCGFCIQQPSKTWVRVCSSFVAFVFWVGSGWKGNSRETSFWGVRHFDTHTHTPMWLWTIGFAKPPGQIISSNDLQCASFPPKATLPPLPMIWNPRMQSAKSRFL